MKTRVKIVQQYRRLRAQGEKEAAAQTAATFRCSASSVRHYERTWRNEGKRGFMPVIKVRESPPKTPWDVIQLLLLFRRL